MPYTLSPWKMAPRPVWSKGSLLIVALFEIGNTKQWKTKRVVCVIYQEIFKIKTGIVSDSVVIFFCISCFFCSVRRNNGKTLCYCFDLILIWQRQTNQ